jgi:hydrogenase-4 component E
MLTLFLLTGILILTYAMLVCHRIPGLIRNFRLQSLFLFFVTLDFACRHKETGIFIVAGLLLLVKVVLIPSFLTHLVKKIKVDERLGLFLNPLLSLVIALLLTWGASVFCSWFFGGRPTPVFAAFVVSITVVMTGFLIMVVRMKAVSQIVGLLVMENGIFLLAGAIAGGMPFFVEIAVAFDVFVCAIITGIFMYRINKVFTHIEVHRLTDLKG